MAFTLLFSSITALTAAEVFTIYHVNPRNYSAQGIAEMDTGDALGDFYFAGRSVCAPMECATDPSSHDCTNPEVASPDLTVTKVIADMGNRSDWSKSYARCNIGPPYAPPGVYKCLCGASGVDKCSGQVGVESVADHFGTHSVKTDEKWSFWRRNLAWKTLGTWFSTPAAGQGRYWKVVQTVKQINKTCHDDHVWGHLASHNPGCFAGCGGASGKPLNRSSDCAIDCFYSTVMGPDSGTSAWTANTTLPSGDTILTRVQLAALYDAPFSTCPSVTA